MFMMHSLSYDYYYYALLVVLCSDTTHTRTVDASACHVCHSTQGGSSNEADVRTYVRCIHLGRSLSAQLRFLAGIVMMPYLTPYGAALRRQGQLIYKQLLDTGLRPTWRSGANLRYTDSTGITGVTGVSVLYDCEAAPAA